MEPLSERAANGPGSMMSRPADAAATLVAIPEPLNGVPSDGDEPARPCARFACLGLCRNQTS